MSPKSRWLILLVSTPLVILAGVGGLLGASQPSSQQSFKDLPVFQDVVSLIMSSYVDRVDIDKVMEGAMRGLADGLDPASAYLTPDEVRLVRAGAPLPIGDVGLVLSRRFYLLVLGVRDGSPAARAGLRTGDFIRGIDGKPTRDISAFAGARLLRGAPGTKVQLTVIRGNAAEPHVVDLVRERPAPPAVTGRILPGGEAYVRVDSFGPGTAAALRRHFEGLQKNGTTAAVVDLRGIADGAPDDGLAAARLFVAGGTLATLSERSGAKTVTAAASGDGGITMPVVLLVSNGTANAAEVFAAALSGNRRAELVGEPTAGLAGVQRLVALPENRGLWMTYGHYLAPDGKVIHERGLTPTVAVEEPIVQFGETAPTTDEALQKAIERLRSKKAA